MNIKRNLSVVVFGFLIFCGNAYGATGNTIDYTMPLGRPTNVNGIFLEDKDTLEGKLAEFNVSLGLCKPSKTTIAGSSISVLRSNKGCNVKISKGSENIMCNTMKNTRFDLFLKETYKNNFENCDSSKKGILQKKISDYKAENRIQLQKECASTNTGTSSLPTFVKICGDINKKIIKNYDEFLVSVGNGNSDENTLLTEVITDPTEFETRNKNWLEKCKDAIFDPKNEDNGVCFSSEGIKFKDVNERINSANKERQDMQKLEKLKIIQRPEAIIKFKNRCEIRNMILLPDINPDSFGFTPNLSSIRTIKDVRDSNQKVTTVYSLYNYPFYKKQNISDISVSPVYPMEPTKLTKGKETIEILTDYFSLGLRQTRQSDAIKIGNDLLYKENTLFLGHAVYGSRYTVVLEEHPYGSQTTTNYIYIYSCK